MSNLYESKFMQKVKSIGEKCAGNKAIAAVSAGMMMAMGHHPDRRYFPVDRDHPDFLWGVDDGRCDL